MFRNGFCFLLLLLASLSQAQIVEESGSFIAFMADEEPAAAYDNWISHVVEGIARPGYNVYAPAELDPQLNGFGQFDEIEDNTFGDQLLAMFEELADSLLAGSITGAQAVLDSGPAVDYQLVRFTDSDSGHELLILRELLDNSYLDPGDPENPNDDVVGSFNHGWGIYVFDPAALRPHWIVQAPHPNDDYMSSYMAVDSFVRHGAGILMINGAGREVLYTGDPGSYTNSRSISDPTRNCRHPFSVMHERMISHIRGAGIFERTLQIHSYDDASHRDLMSCVVSDGRYRRKIQVPLYDASGGPCGLINNVPRPVHPAASFGFFHDAVPVQTYMSNQALNRICLEDESSTTCLNISVNLWGFPESCQEDVSHDDLDDCHQEEVWIHVEMDELPTVAHDLGEDFWYFIDGEDAAWDHFARCRQYYRPLFDALAEAEDSLAVADSGPAPDTPENFEVSEIDVDRLVLGWDPVASRFFDTYELLMDPSGEITAFADVLDMGDYSSLCWAPLDHLELEDLDYQVTYAFALRGVDMDGRVGGLSDTLLATPDDLVPPTLTERFLANHDRYWIGAEGGTVKVLLRDEHHNVDLSSLQWRIDHDGDGNYHELTETWQSAGLEGVDDFVNAEFDVVSNGSGIVNIEFRVHDDQHPVYACSGTNDACGIGDDWEVGIDPDAPADFTGMPQVELDPEDSDLLLSWPLQVYDSTFYSYEVAINSTPFDVFENAEWLLDRTQDGELDDAGDQTATLNQYYPLADSLYLRMRQVDAAGNAGGASEQLCFANWHPTMCEVQVDSMRIVSNLLHFYWSSGCQIEGMSANGWWLHALAGPWDQPDESTRLMYVTQAHATLEWSQQLDTPFFLVVATDIEVARRARFMGNSSD